jgi:hypothetical protein
MAVIIIATEVAASYSKFKCLVMGNFDVLWASNRDKERVPVVSTDYLCVLSEVYSGRR